MKITNILGNQNTYHSDIFLSNSCFSRVARVWCNVVSAGPEPQRNLFQQSNDKCINSENI